MRILFLTQIIPYPPDAGPRVKTLNVLRYLAEQGHQIVLASFVRPEEEKCVPALQKICASVYTAPIRRSRVADAKYWLRSFLNGRPFLVERDNLQTMHQLVQYLLATQTFDVIHADQLAMAQFVVRNVELKSSSRPFLIFDAHNAVWTIVERMRETAPWFLRFVLRIEAWRIKEYEGQVIRSFDHTLAVTEPDRQALLQAVDVSDNASKPMVDKTAYTSRITVIPISVDMSRLQPIRRRMDSTTILALGTLHYPPNADGIRWFSNDIFPQIRKDIPEAKLTIVGKNPPKDIIELEHRNPSSIRVTGYVPDLVPYLEGSSVMVVPVRAGGGMRVRILEGFAWAMPIVTTSVGLEGICAKPGEDVLVADTGTDFASAVVSLLKNEGLQAKLAANARCLAEKHYDCRVVQKQLDKVYILNREDYLV